MPNFDNISLNTIQRGFLAEAGQEDAAVRNYEIGFSLVVLVCLSFFSHREATKLFIEHHTNLRIKKTNEFGLIAKDVVLAEITPAGDDKSMTIGGRFEFIERQKYGQPVIFVRDLLTNQEKMLVEGKTLEDLKLQALFYTAADKIVRMAEIRTSQIFIDPFVLNQTTEKYGEIVLEIRDGGKFNPVQLSSGKTLDDLRLLALRYLVKDKLITSPQITEGDDRQQMKVKDMTFIEDVVDGQRGIIICIDPYVDKFTKINWTGGEYLGEFQHLITPWKYVWLPTGLTLHELQINAKDTREDAISVRESLDDPDARESI